MLFKRRDTVPMGDKIKNLIWPHMGFKRLLDYYKYRSIRLPANDKSIARGMAFGCLVSWTPTFGTHLIQCAAFCWLTRSNFIASFIGSALGNFITTPFMMLISYHVGKFILYNLGLEHLLIHHADTIMEVTDEALQKPKIFLPTLVGGYAFGILTYPIFYYASFYMVKTTRAARQKRIEMKAHQAAHEMTGTGE
jgi:hypothetical protein